MLSSGDANKINWLLCYVLGVVHNGAPVPTSDTALDAAAALADRAHKALGGGLTGDQVRQLWVQRQPVPAMPDRAERPAPQPDDTD